MLTNPFYRPCFSSLLPFISVRTFHVAASIPSPPEVLSCANIGCRACSLRFEVHFRQILPCIARVIYRKKHREWLFRQPFTAPKNRSGFRLKDVEQRESKLKFKNGWRHWKNCYKELDVSVRYSTVRENLRNPEVRHITFWWICCMTLNVWLEKVYHV